MTLTTVKCCSQNSGVNQILALGRCVCILLDKTDVYMQFITMAKNCLGGPLTDRADLTVSCS